MDTKSRVKFIDGIRAIAVLTVFTMHMKPMVINTLKYSSHHVIADTILSIYKYFPFIGAVGGHLGVDAFFVISGFLIYTILERKPEMNPIRFMRYRYARLLPAHAFLIIPLLVRKPLPDVITNLSMLGVFVPDFKVTNFVTWTLSYEIFFYFITSVYFFALNLLKKKSSWFSVVLFIIGYYALQYYINNVLHSEVKLLGGRFYAFFVGVIVAKLQLSYSTNIEKIKPLYKKLSIFISMLAIYLIKLNWEFKWISFKGKPYNQYSLVAVLFGIFLFITLNTDAFVKKILDIPVLQQIGKISYSFYLSHVIIGRNLARKLFFNVDSAVPPILRAGLLVLSAFLITYTYSFFSYKYLEEPYFTNKKRT